MPTYFDSGVLAKLAAIVLGSTDFVSLDARQRKLATLGGLRVHP